MQITIRQIEAFLAVAESGSFSLAAARMNAAQPAISQAVRDLETALDVRLFDRTTRRVDLTEAARILRDQLTKGMEEIHRAVEAVQDVAALRRGTLRIAAPPLLAAALLPAAIASFSKAHPDIRVDLADVSTDRIVEQVLSGQSEIGVGTFPPGDDRLERLPVLNDDMMLFCRHDDALASAAGTTWAALSGRPLVTLTRESGIRLLTEVGFETAQVGMRPRFEVTQITTAIALVEAGLGVSVLPGYAQSALVGRPVMAVPLLQPTISRDVVVLHRRDRSLTPAARAFVERLRTTWRQRRPSVRE